MPGIVVYIFNYSIRQGLLISLLTRTVDLLRADVLVSTPSSFSCWKREEEEVSDAAVLIRAPPPLDAMLLH